MESSPRYFLKAKYIIPVIITFFFVYMFVRKSQATNDLKKNGVFVNAKIIEFLGTSKGGDNTNPNYRCEFAYKGKGKTLITQSSVKRKAFPYVGKSYPALYSEKTNRIRVLITQEDFEKYDRKYPDSLLEKNLKK